MLIFLKLIRVRSWAKNLLVFALPLSAGNPFSNFNISILEFIILSLSSSFNYVINDLKDSDVDSVHPTKRFRPIAANLVSRNLAYTYSLLLLISFTILNHSLPNNSLQLVNYIFLLLQLVYSLYLKFVPILEILLLSNLYVIRTVIPYYYVNVNFSFWFFAIFFFGSMFLVLVKREAEMKTNKGRLVLESYTSNFLTNWSLITITCTLVTFSLWTLEVFVSTGSYLVFGMLLPLLAIMMKLSNESDLLLKQDSVKFVFRNKMVVLSFLVLIFMYLKIKGLNI